MHVLISTDNINPAWCGSGNDNTILIKFPYPTAILNMTAHTFRSLTAQNPNTRMEVQYKQEGQTQWTSINFNTGSTVINAGFLLMKIHLLTPKKLHSLH